MHRFFLNMSQGFAYLGGLMLVALILLTCVSVLGRKLNDTLHGMVSDGILVGPARWLLDAGIGAINGDFELIEAGIAFSIFAFCHCARSAAAMRRRTFLPPNCHQALIACSGP